MPLVIPAVGAVMIGPQVWFFGFMSSVLTFGSPAPHARHRQRAKFVLLNPWAVR